MQKAT